MSHNQLLTSLVTKAVTCIVAACLVTPELQPHQSVNWHWRQWQFLKDTNMSRITQPTTSFSLLPWYTCPLFQSQMLEILAFSWPGFPKTSQRLPKFSNGFPKTSEHCRKYPKMSGQRQRFFDIYHAFKNNLCGFVSQVWEIVLDAWDQRV